MNAFREGLKVLVASKPRFSITREQADVWELLLSDIPGEALLLAAMKLARESEYDPTPASWRKRALEISGAAVSRLTAAEAWDEMRRNRKRYSPYERNQNHEIRWSSEAVHRAAQAVNWTDAGWTTEQIPTIRAQFERYYNAIAEKQEVIDSVNDTLALLPSMQKLLSATDTKRLLGGGS